MTIQQRVFSLEEANALLPELETLLQRFHSVKESCERSHDYVFMHELLNAAESSSSQAEMSKLEEAISDMDSSIDELEKVMECIRGLGCIIRNVEKGWIDFPGKREQSSIYFCWQNGEKSIQYYHTSQCTPDGRARL